MTDCMPLGADLGVILLIVGLVDVLAVAAMLLGAEPRTERRLLQGHPAGQRDQHREQRLTGRFVGVQVTVESSAVAVFAA